MPSDGVYKYMYRYWVLSEKKSAKFMRQAEAWEGGKAIKKDGYSFSYKMEEKITVNSGV